MNKVIEEKIKCKSSDNKKDIIFSELYVFISFLPLELKNKISKRFIKYVNDNANRVYCIQIAENVKRLELSRETEIIIGMIYRDFFCSNEERNKLYENEKKILSNYNNKKQGNYNIDDLLKNKKANKVKDEMILNNQVNIVNNNKNELLIIKEKWYKKIFDKIKNFFRRK